MKASFQVVVLQAKAQKGMDDSCNSRWRVSLVELLPEPAWVLNLNMYACESKGLSSNFHKSRIGLKQVKGMAAILVGNAKQ